MECIQYAKEKQCHITAFVAVLFVKYYNKLSVFSTCIVKIFYKLLVQKLFQHFVKNIILKETINIDDSGVYKKNG